MKKYLTVVIIMILSINSIMAQKLTTQNATYDFGQILFRTPATAVFKIKNTSHKQVKIKEIYGFDNLHGVVIVDDSMDNCVDIYNHGGTPIYVNPGNKPNPYEFAMVKSTKPESIYRELERCGYGDANSEILQKPKTLRR